MKGIIGAISLCLLLTACGLEPEERSFVGVMCFEGQKNTRLTLLTGEGVAGEEQQQKNLCLIRGQGSSPEKALEQCRSYSSGQMFFGHTGLIIMDKGFLQQPKAVAAAADFIRHNTQVSRRAVILAADNPGALLETRGEGEPLWVFVEEYYKAHREKQPFELDALLRLKAEGGCGLIPLIEQGSNGLEIKGGVLMEGLQVAGSPDGEQALALQWLLGKGYEPYIYTGSSPLEIRGKGLSFKPYRVVIRLRCNKGSRDEAAKAYVRQRAEDALEILRQKGCSLREVKRACEIAGVEYDKNKPVEVEIK